LQALSRGFVNIFFKNHNFFIDLRQIGLAPDPIRHILKMQEIPRHPALYPKGVAFIRILIEKDVISVLSHVIQHIIHADSIQAGQISGAGTNAPGIAFIPKQRMHYFMMLPDRVIPLKPQNLRNLMQEVVIFPDTQNRVHGKIFI